MNYASPHRPVVVTYEFDNLLYTAAIHPIDHPGYLHSLFWFTNDFVMRTWGNLREPLEYAKRKLDKEKYKTVEAPFTRQKLELTVRDGDQYAVLELKVKTIKQYSEGLYSLLATITQVTGGSWYQAVHDILAVLDNCQAQLAAVNSIPLGPLAPADAPTYNSVVRPTGSTYHPHEHHEDYHQVITPEGSFWSPSPYAMDALVRHHTMCGILGCLSAEEFYQMYIAYYSDPGKDVADPAQGVATPENPIMLMEVVVEPGCSDVLEWDGTALQFRSDKSLCELPHPTLGWDLPRIIWDKMFPGTFTRGGDRD